MFLACLGVLLFFFLSRVNFRFEVTKLSGAWSDMHRNGSALEFINAVEGFVHTSQKTMTYGMRRPSPCSSFQELQAQRIWGNSAHFWLERIFKLLRYQQADAIAGWAWPYLAGYEDSSVFIGVSAIQNVWLDWLWVYGRRSSYEYREEKEVTMETGKVMMWRGKVLKFQV